MEVKCGELTLAKNLKIANTFYSRLMGLMFTKRMKSYDSLLLQPANSIHTCFMFYPIDVVFLSKDDKIVKIVKKMKPWRMTWLYWRSAKVIEMYGGTVGDNIKKGDQICIS